MPAVGHTVLPKGWRKVTIPSLHLPQEVLQLLLCVEFNHPADKTDSIRGVVWASV